MMFSNSDLGVSPLYSDAAELRSISSRATTPASPDKVRDAFHDLVFPAPPADRPYTYASIVLSLDGKLAYPDEPQGPVVASANRLDPTGGRIDFWILNILRAYADASLLGARTLAAEPNAAFGCLDPDLLSERPTRLGKTDPLLPIVVSLDGSDVPLEHAAFQRADERPMIATCARGGDFLRGQTAPDTVWLGPFDSRADVDADDVAERVGAARQAQRPLILMAGGETPNTPVLLYALRRIGVQQLLVESPTYWWLLLRDQALDELFVNYSSVWIGGTLTPGAASPFSADAHPHSRLLFVGIHPPGFLYTRQQLVYDLPPTG
jgi:riboflavin biosynthesis pyrimidine reductase